MAAIALTRSLRIATAMAGPSRPALTNGAALIVQAAAKASRSSGPDG